MNEFIPMSNKTWRTIVQLPSGTGCLAVYTCLMMNAYYQEEGLYYLTREEIAEECNISVKTVGKVLNILKENGFIDWTTEFNIVDAGNYSYWKYCNNYKIFPQDEAEEEEEEETIFDW